MAINIVMGISGSGKSKFVQKNFPEMKHFSIGKIQRELREQKNTYNSSTELLIKANDLIEEYVLQIIRAGHDVVMEHTLFKAKRRLRYINAIRKVTNEPIIIYYLKPTREELNKNLIESEEDIEEYFDFLWSQTEEIETPNLAEGYEHVYIVTEGIVTESFDKNIELIREAQKECELEEEKSNARKIREKEIQKWAVKMEETGFWHYCDGCGKKEFLTSKQAFDSG